MEPPIDRALREAWATGDVAGVIDAVKRGADPDAKSNGVPLIVAATIGGEARLVEALVAAGADVNARNPVTDGATAMMHIAALPESDGGHLRVCELLLAAGADTSAKDNEGRTALDHAALSGNGKVVRVLKERGAECSAHTARVLDGRESDHREGKWWSR